MLVKGLPLHKTEVALDPKTPVTVSDVKHFVAAEQVSGGSIPDERHDERKALPGRPHEGAGCRRCRIIVTDCAPGRFRPDRRRR